MVFHGRQQTDVTSPHQRVSWSSYMLPGPECFKVHLIREYPPRTLVNRKHFNGQRKGEECDLWRIRLQATMHQGARRTKRNQLRPTLVYEKIETCHFCQRLSRSWKKQYWSSEIDWLIQPWGNADPKLILPPNSSPDHFIPTRRLSDGTQGWVFSPKYCTAFSSHASLISLHTRSLRWWKFVS
jgi:hypothetical protein